jgi:hypothetical protein
MITDMQLRLKYRWEDAKTWRDVAGHEAGLWPIGAQAAVASMLLEIHRLREYIRSNEEAHELFVQTASNLKEIYRIEERWATHETRTQHTAD